MDIDNNQNQQEREIDLLELANVLWKKRKLILKISLLGFIIGIIVAFSIPKTYTTTVTLAPEQAQSSGNVSTIAALTGINISGSNNNVLSSPDLFPTILNSTPFLKGLLDVRIEDQDHSINTTLYVYLKSYQKDPWWSSLMSIPSKILGIFSKNETVDSLSTSVTNENSYIVLTKEEAAIINSLKNSFAISVDKKTNVINLSTTLQDPKISAYLADTVTRYLQEYVIYYRTLKARQDLSFAQKLFDETKSDYYKKQQELANYTDANTGIVSAKYATTRDRLQNEVNLAYNMYNQMAQEYQKTKIKIQDNTPVYTIVEPPVEPLVPSNPQKKMIVIGFVLLFGISSCIWILSKYYLSKQRL